jgi:hypothetical protein
MSAGDGNALSGRKPGKDSDFVELKNKYPQVWQFYSGLHNPYLSDTGYKNLSARFKISLDEFKSIWQAFQKGGKVE